MLTDTHCHILISEYNNIDEIITNLEMNNIKRIVINGYDLESNKEVLRLVDLYDNVYGAIGIHPDNIDEKLDHTIGFIKSNLNHKKIIAIGEVGLDYYHNKENAKLQIEVFERLLKIAEENHKPLIIHSREATSDMLNTLSKYNCKGVIHSFTGSYETAKEYLKLNYKLGINGILTFKNSKLYKVIEKLPLSAFLLETDSPYITPEPLRKYRNEPKYIIYTAKRMAEIKNINISTLSEQLEENFHDVFDIYN